MLLALKIKLGLISAALAAPLCASAVPPLSAPANDQIVKIAPSPFNYQAAGEFSRDGKPTEAPIHRQQLKHPIFIMKNLVTVADYTRCVEAGSCQPVAQQRNASNVPIVGINWHDATAYAAWMTKTTGIVHRLPTDEEWTFAAAEKVTNEVVPVLDLSDPAQAWIARYEAEAQRERPTEPQPQPTGAFGTNSNGLNDVAGNVWEWTSSCYLRVKIDGVTENVVTTNCGVRVVEGGHRSYMTDFIRDPKVGGCAAGAPPTNLGFRLVIESGNPIIAKIKARIYDL